MLPEKRQCPDGLSQGHQDEPGGPGEVGEVGDDTSSSLPQQLVLRRSPGAGADPMGMSSGSMGMPLLRA
ncbi:hypothetical protein Sp245p_22275 (plasmid) [Azospirillum baldaniorum]|nr:hypothetical protein Sp245p_22275 [Azospirillum baldaniorum]